MTGTIGMIRYSSRQRVLWDLFLTLAIAVAFLDFSYHLTFRRIVVGPLYWVLIAAFIADIVLSFNSETRKRLALFSDRPTIARNYLRGWFVPDVIAAIPLVGLVGLAGGRVPEGPAGTVALVAIWLLPLSKTAKLVALLRRIQDRLKLNPGVMRLVVFAFLFVLAVHSMGLGWVLIAATDPDRSHFDQYLRAIYWCVTTIATIGYGDYYPNHDSNSQIAYTIVVQVIGVGFYGYIIGNMASLIANLDVAKANLIWY